MTNEPSAETVAPDELGILARRRIEAAIIAPIYAELRAEIGEERAKALIARAIAQPAMTGKERYVLRVATQKYHDRHVGAGVLREERKRFRKRRFLFGQGLRRAAPALEPRGCRDRETRCAT